MSLAPIALFVFKRPELARRTIESLRANPEIEDSQVVVFADGPRDARDEPFVRSTREAIRAGGLPKMEIIERTENLGLAKSIIDGVGRLVAAHGRVIVIEDDLRLSPTFLRFMNAALDRYAADERVYHVSGYQFPVAPPATSDAFLLPFVNSWGWGTWARSWSAFDASASGYAALRDQPRLRRQFDLDGSFYFYEMLEAQVQGRLDSWFIRWYLSVFSRGGLGVFPARSLVENTGFGSDATHTKAPNYRYLRAHAHPLTATNFPRDVDAEMLRRVKRFLWWDTAPNVNRARRVLRILRNLFSRRH